ncbi:MAG: bifunctional UDP-N-acetylmuramoyl-tripeptide:D-alanyl-D-alanine ligase/alanine racemase [Bacteroidia bacterium]
MKYKASKIAEICRGNFFSPSGINPEIEHFLIDSRKIISAENALFIAISGERHKGSDFIPDVYASGVRAFFINKSEWSPTYSQLYSDAIFIQVENTLTGFQQLAKSHRESFELPVVGITGSNGKTIVKEWLYHLLHEDVSIIRNPKSYNSQIGVPLSLLLIQQEHQLGIFEAGISLTNEMEKLEAMLQPNIGIFTFLGEAHQQGFANKEEKIQEKLKLFKSSQKVIIGIDQEIVAKNLETITNQQQFFTWTLNNQIADVSFHFIKGTNYHTLMVQNSGLAVQIPFSDEASIWNACSCLAYLIFTERFNQETESIFSERFKSLPVLDMRLQLKEGNNNCIIINDSYSADLDSLKIALDFLQQNKADLASTVILSDIYESGIQSESLYKKVKQLLTDNHINKLIAIGPNLLAQKHVLPAHTIFYPDTQTFLQNAHPSDFQQQIILIKGARKFAFEKISKWFEKKVHQTIFEINLNALVQNLNTYKSNLKPGVKTMAMVKAFSYGAGSFEIARMLEFNRVDYLTVAYADEGTTLRKAGIKTPIMVMNPEPASFDAILKYNLEPEIYQFQILKSLIQNLNGEECGIHLEFDTGMKRLGFNSEDIPELISLLKEYPQLRIKSVFTHLAASESTEHDVFTQTQIDRFKTISEELCAAFNYPILRHCLNSGGIIRFPDAQFDMVRLGIGLYGIDPAEEIQSKLQIIGTLKTVVSQIRILEPGESVGYGRKGKVNETTKIAIVAIGYADGLNRLLSNGNGYMLINGKPAPIIGNICMDMTMLNINGIDCKEGDEVIVFGEKPNLLEISAAVQSIPYEILTGISQRVKRVYFFE